jgi:hypothetical protein
MKPSAAYAIRRLLCGEPVNGEADRLPPALQRLCGLLGETPLEDRLRVWDGFRLSLPDPEAAVMAVAAADPLGPPPEEEARRSAHLGDLTDSVSASRFVWPGWIVRGHFNLFSSDPKIGKTHVALDLARRIWFRLDWPDGQPPTFPENTPTLWVCGDRHQDELRERAAAFGLPPEAVRLNALPEEPYGGWDLDNPDNVARLRELIEADRPGLTVIDTVWRSTRRRLRCEEEVNELMSPILTDAQETDSAFLGLMHLSKDGETLGRRLEGLARAVLKLHKPDPDQSDRRRLSVIGNFKEPPPLGVTIKDGGCDYDFDPPEEAERRSGPPPAKLRAATDWLRGRLATPAPVVDLRKEAAAAGVIPSEGSAATLYQAKDALTVQEYEVAGRKWWKLPLSE